MGFRVKCLNAVSSQDPFRAFEGFPSPGPCFGVGFVAQGVVGLFGGRVKGFEVRLHSFPESPIPLN